MIGGTPPSFPGRPGTKQGRTEGAACRGADSRHRPGESFSPRRRPGSGVSAIEVRLPTWRNLRAWAGEVHPGKPGPAGVAILHLHETPCGIFRADSPAGRGHGRPAHCRAARRRTPVRAGWRSSRSGRPAAAIVLGAGIPGTRAGPDGLPGAGGVQAGLAEGEPGRSLGQRPGGLG
jgi:hypothetical protein